MPRRNKAKNVPRYHGCSNECRGCSYYSRGKYHEALEIYNKDLVSAKLFKDKAGEERAYRFIGDCYGSLGQYKRALEHYKMALNIAKEIGDKKKENISYLNRGLCYEFRGQYKKAEEQYKMHLSIAQQIGDKVDEGRTYSKLGNCYHSLLQYEEAREHNEMALNLAKQVKDKKGEMRAYHNLGKCYLSEGENSKAINNLEMALSIAKRSGGKTEEGYVYGNLGESYRFSEQYVKAMEQNEKQLSIAKKIGDKKLEGHALSDLALSNRALGQYDKAIQQHQMHLTIAKQMGDKAEEEKAYTNLGDCYNSVGQHDMATKHYKMGLNIAEQRVDETRKSCVHNHLAIFYKSLGQYDEAIEHYEVVLEIADRIGNQRSRGSAHSGLGTCYLSSEEHEKALEHYLVALRIAREIGDKIGEYTAHLNVGVCYFHFSEHRKAIRHYSLYLYLSKHMEAKEDKWKVHHNLAQCYMALEQYEKAESSFRSCLQCTEKLLDESDGDQFKVSMFDTEVGVHVYRLLIENLVLQGKTEDALVIAERGRARALANLMMANHSVRFSDLTMAKALDLDCICEVVKALGSTMLFYTLLCHRVCTWVIQLPGNVTLNVTKFSGVSTQTQQHHSQGFTPHGEDLIWLIKRAMAVLKLGCIPRCEDRSLSFLHSEVRPGNMNNAVPTNLAHSQSRSAPPIDSLYSVTRQGKGVSATKSTAAQTSDSPPNSDGKPEESDSDPLEELYHIVLGPVRKFVEGSQVVVVPDGPLALVPFAALVDETGRYLVESLQVRLVPSLATARMIYKHPAHACKGQARSLIVGDPDVGAIKNGDNILRVRRLPHTNTEAQAIGQLFNVQPLTGKRATKKTFLENVESATLIHIAAHGDMERGEILLAPSPNNDGRTPTVEDALLTISDLEHKRLNAKLVVLSSCHSAHGKIRAEGIIGIARAFVGAGARAVLVTLWAIEDEATLYFMREFYEQLIRGKRANEAQSKAMKALKESEEYSHPYYWAPFVLIGDDVVLTWSDLTAVVCNVGSRFTKRPKTTRAREYPN